MSETITQKKKHHNQVRRIWMVFWILAVVTSVEVLLGIIRPEFLVEASFWNMELLTWIFIILTIVKAYYITWTFMHMEQEAPSLRRAVIWTIVFYLGYIIFIFLAEGDYLHDVIHNGYVLWNF